MKLKDYSLLFIFVIVGYMAFAQQKVSGTITNTAGQPINKVEVYDKVSGRLTTTNTQGYYEFSTEKTDITLVFFSYEFKIKEVQITINGDVVLNQTLEPLGEELTAVEITARKTKVFELSRLRDVEETAIYAGKKTEVVLVEQSMANLATNNARQIYSQVAGLNIYQNDDAGLQLNIGGRGLDPNRTANFNTRQNGYDISADVLGYPESYYSPAAEGLKEIQVIRGAASLQYGTQFGGLINFVMKEPNPNKPFELVTRNTLGSFGLYTNFTSVSGTKDKWSYYTFFNYKRGDGFRPNSEFESKNIFAHIGYQLSERTKLSAELTYLDYLAQQAGGLTDNMFNEDPYQSNRARNWFEVDWLLYNFKLAHQFSEKTNFTFNFFGLNATRNALGFRTNRVDQVDPGQERDLIKGNFNNYGFEARLLSEYKLFNKDATFLIGSKFYNANNSQQQGPGSAGIGPNFNLQTEDYPNYPDQSDFDFPNLNIAVFGENILYLNDKFSITPGFRFEYIKTESEGFYQRINTDAAGNVIFEETVEDNRDFERNFILLGLGLSYKPNSNGEVYGNISQNYRSVTFSDININNPAFTINPEITDEDGFTVDLGFRGNYKRFVSYDVGAFALFYNDRIGFVQKGLDDGRVVSERGNIGNAVMYGVESLFDFNLKKILRMNNDYSFNYFINTSIIKSEYTSSEQSGIEGNEVEFVPDLNLKTGLRFGYKNLMANAQYTYLGRQFTDATNSLESNLSGVIGEIPEYDILDISLSYTYKMFKLETGVNNVFDNAYFTRRATGYPGPGIIPSAPRNWFTTLEVTF
ncbi:TonB-dependent receptor domain-containing protein [Winogradskyella ouciana]|uniref:TonB-dependent receptor plug domain-containing protein n=1 Tax=Winogradskyella ouciana TaxID=2608631 RepID=A0A7K1GH11_9FLAO|nr:TonB-dependent receptor [Winogradskyella ouciana]MTE27784.1 TonB-dependent receptor plug domain-containing protein [Winogradskyella ouciana]